MAPGSSPKSNGAAGDRDLPPGFEPFGTLDLGRGQPPRLPAEPEPAAGAALPLAQFLAPQHVELIRASGISDAVRDARGYWTATRRRELRDLGFSEGQQRVVREAARSLNPATALVIPVWGVTGEEPVLHLARPDEPYRGKDGKVVKYMQPTGTQLVLDVPPTVRPLLRDPSVPLGITEGPRKADAAVSVGLCYVALLGVWAWKSGTVLPDFEYIAWKDRTVYVAFDSDFMTSTDVHAAARRLKEILGARGAKVCIVYLPSGEHGEKVGLDDYLAAGHSKHDLLALASGELREPSRPAGDYTMSAAGITYAKPTPHGHVDQRLTNFAARIRSEVEQDDGVERRLLFQIEAQLGLRKRSFDVTAAQFPNLNWAIEHLGAEAVIFPGQLAREHARTAIQVLSGTVPRRITYTHTGWRLVNGLPVYLHGAGAIGPGGAVAGIETDLGLAELGSYRLPDPPTGAVLVDAIRTSLAIWELAPDPISISVSATIFRAPLGACDFSSHLAGPTGAGKTELAALAAQHFGPEMDARHLAGWLSTANTLEAMAFGVKDAVLVVDDFAPTGSIHDVQRAHREADRLLRAQGNRSGRGRMRPDGSIRPAKPPRGVILSTGEDVPRGQSLRARLPTLELGRNDLDFSKLAALQKAAAAGVLAQTTSGYVCWLARRYDGLGAEVRARVLELREVAVRSATHRRTPEIVANLAVGIEYFLNFALEAGAIDRHEYQARWERAWLALGEAGKAQAGQQESQEPTTRFVNLLRAALVSGAAHLAAPSGDEPESLQAWGWRDESNAFEQRWTPQGRRIGWVDGDNVYLEPEAAFEIVQRLGQAGGEPLTIGLRVLQSRLFDKGLLASIEERADHRRLTVRVRGLEGRRIPVLHLLTTSVFPPDDVSLHSEKRDQRDPRSPRDGESEFGSAQPGPKSGSHSPAEDPQKGPIMDQKGPGKGTQTGESEFSEPSPGPFGPFSEQVERGPQSEGAEGGLDEYL